MLLSPYQGSSSAIAARLQGGEPSLKHVVEIGQPFFNEPV